MLLTQCHKIDVHHDAAIALHPIATAALLATIILALIHKIDVHHDAIINLYPIVTAAPLAIVVAVAPAVLVVYSVLQDPQAQLALPVLPELPVLPVRLGQLVRKELKEQQG